MHITKKFDELYGACAEKKDYPTTAWEQWLSRTALDKQLVTIQFWSTGTLPVERGKITALQESHEGE
ncbi:MAG: hypothetical protein ACXV8I_04325 [Methylobacter sp.]